MELICPSCEARYGVPDGAIARQGRDVSCTNCGYGWRAMPPVGEVAMPSAGQGGMTEEARPTSGLGGEGAGAAELHALRTNEPSRNAQLVEIREMIAQVQSENGIAASREAPAAPSGTPLRASPGPEGRGATFMPGEAPSRTELRRIDDIEESGGETALHQDPLRRRMAELDARASRNHSDRDQMRRSMFNRNQDRSAGSGAFLTGFLLVLLIGAAMLAAYAMRPTLIERFPESAPLLTEYGNGVDDVRSRIADGYDRGRSWVIRTVGESG
jgi:predicted Zn finger-like uncharacterized protein